MKRHKHSLSHYKLASFDMGELIPVGCYEVLPGDSIQQATSALLRVSPLLTPVMHPVQVRIHHWFVPNRLVWSGWEDFITGVNPGTYPVNVFAAGSPSAGSLWDYFGVPPSVGAGNGFVAASLLPIRGYNLIYNEFYRDQDLVTEVASDLGTVQKISWQKDRFTAARPWAQKGGAITLPLGTQAPVKTDMADAFTGVQAPLHMRVAGTGAFPAAADMMSVQGAGGVVSNSSTAPGAQTLNLYPTNLYADLTNATAVDVNDVRRAFALQRYAEARAQYGSRYTEYLRYLGVRSSDARLQRPEYLGGGKQTIAFSEVLQTATGGTFGVGALNGHGIAAMRSRRYRRFFEEHGHVLSLMSVRPRTMYMNGIDKMFLRRTKEDYWQKELELIGQEGVQKAEIFAIDDATNDDVWGYNDRYASYRHIMSGVTGEFRTSTLNMWHLARSFAAAPTLNQAFIECVPSKRINAVQTNDVLWVMVNHSIQARRMVTKSTIGRII